jgi:hypothetical protein
MAEDHVRKSVGECHPCREFEGMQPSIYMKTSSASATGVSPWTSYPLSSQIGQFFHPICTTSSRRIRLTS